MTEPAKLGRPRGFDASRAVENAMELFWDRGYRGASVAEIARATGVLPGSLYGAFGDKRRLFRACLTRYRADGADHVREALDGGASPFDGLRTYLEHQVDLACGTGEHHGCLMAKTALELAPADEETTEIVRDNFRALRELLADAVREAQAAGEMSDRWEPDAVAGAMLALVEGFQVLGRTERPDALRDVAALLLEALR